MRTMTFRSTGRLVWMAMFLGGCTAVGPDYVAPSADLEGTYRSTVATSDSEPVDLEWWRGFDDPLLESLVEEALNANHDIEIARANLRRVRALRQVDTARELPSVDARGGYSRVRGSENGAIDIGALDDAGVADRETDLFDLGFDASWELDIFGAVQRRVEAADARAGIAEEALHDVTLSLLAELTLTYIELRGAERRAAVIENNVETQTRTRDIVRDKHRTGLVPRIDVTRAEAQLRSTQALLPNVRARIQSALFRLAVLTDRRPGELDRRLRGASTLAVRGQPIPVGLPSELLRRRPDIRLAERRLRLATAELGIATTDLYPRFFLSGSVGVQSTDFADLFESESGFFSLGPSLHWPIFQGGALKARQEAAQAALDAEHLRFRQAVLTAVEDVERSLVAYAEEELRRRELQAARDASAESVALAHVLYEKGLSEFLTVLDAERRLREAEDLLAMSETQLAKHLVATHKALGGGWESGVDVR